MACRSTGANIRCVITFWKVNRPVSVPEWRDGTPLLFLYSKTEGGLARFHQPLMNGKNYEIVLPRAG